MSKKTNTTATGFMKDNKTKPLEKMSTAELRETFDRQTKLLKNKAFLQKLPDKGARIEESQQRIEALLKEREQADQLAKLMSGLSLKVKDIHKMEWGSDQVVTNQEVDQQNLIDDKDDAVDDQAVLKILATTNLPVKSTQVAKKHVITPEELAVLGEDKFSKELVDLAEHKPDHHTHKDRFLPNRSLRHDHLTPDLEKNLANGGSRGRLAGVRTHHRNDDITSAHEPPSRYDHVKPLDLEESLKLQLEQAEQLKKIELQRASERLAQRFDIKLGDLPDHLLTDMRHRGTSEDVDDILGGLRDRVNNEIEEEEVFDEDDVKDTGGVTYTYTEIS